MLEPPQQQEDDGVDRSSCNTATSSLGQSQFDAYQQLQQRATETLRVFTTQGVVSAPTGGRQTNRTISRGNPGGGGGSDAGDGAATEYIPLDEMYAREYNKDMDRRWANEPPLVFGEQEEEDGDQWSGEEQEGNDIDEEEGRSPTRRRNLFGRDSGGEDGDEGDNDMDEQPRSSHSSREEEDEGAGGHQRHKRRQRMRSDDNPRQHKRHCPPPRRQGGDDPFYDDQTTTTYDTRTRHECFLCAWGNVFHDGIEAPHINKMTDIIQQNYGVHHNKEICSEVVLYYMQEVYDPALGMAPLTRQCVMEHLEHHILDARIFIGEAIKREKQLAFLFLNKIWRPDGTFDKGALVEYRHSMKDICGYYNMNVTRMNFNNGNSAEDMKKQANYMNLMMPRFDQCEKKQRQAPTTPRARNNGQGGRRTNNDRASPDRTSVPPSRKQFT